MQHVRLGRTGLNVSRICLGTMTFGLQVDEAGSFAILDAAAEKGITFLDTADAYPLGGDLTTVGRTEEIVGKWLQGKRDDYVVATKCFAPMGRRPWHMGNSRRHIMDSIDASLRRLQTDFVDLYQLHFDDPGVPLEESLGALDDLVRVGKVRYVGCSNFLAYRLARATGISAALGPRALRLDPAPLQPAVPRVRARAVPAVPRGGHRRDPVQPDRGRHALGEARPHEGPGGRDALHARQRGADLPGPLLARQRVRHRRPAREDRRRGRPAACRRSRSRGRWRTRPSRRRSSARAGPTSSTRRARRSTRSSTPIS